MGADHKITHLPQLHRVHPLVLIHGRDLLLTPRLLADGVQPVSNPVAVELLEGLLISLAIALRQITSTSRNCERSAGDESLLTIPRNLHKSSLMVWLP